MKKELEESALEECRFKSCVKIRQSWVRVEVREKKCHLSSLHVLHKAFRHLTYGRVPYGSVQSRTSFTISWHVLIFKITYKICKYTHVYDFFLYLLSQVLKMTVLLHVTSRILVNRYKRLVESPLLLPASWQKIEAMSFSQENADELHSMDKV